MTELGIFFSCEERSAPDILDAAVKAEQAGFRTAWISDHFHPWNDEQGNSPFVWSVLGAVAHATQEMRWMTAVTCPTIRTHPGIVAQAAATTETLMPGRFRLGVGTGEALNEHMFGARWPEAAVRREMLEEAVAVIRQLWEGGEQHHHGTHYTLEGARIYSLPETAPEILVSGFGDKAIDLAARIGDGFVNVGPDAEAVERYRGQGGKGVTQTGIKVCWGEDRDACRTLVHRLWPNDALEGELAQILPSPHHFEQATALVTEEHIEGSLPLGPDPEEHIAAIKEHFDAGYDEVFVSQIGPDHDGFLAFYEREILPHFA
ncbi:F420-dependent glucose-6-phosphate dehydrogenase 1 [Paraconexibacter sp. AEG42_29]|uniref:F420-dependent glucose-6-phosphate dehydrogenase 1 n=1 Tax=Paraconexibacter sp. AEG42_29 TaxID=2997339 RepID=A0AAU7ATX2_9ACTN